MTTRRSIERLCKWIVALWETTQVELHGYYSIEQLQRLEEYRAHTSWLRAILVCLLTPVPCILSVILVDLMPLESPEKGTLQSPIMWLREWLTILQITICMLTQVHQHLPQLALSRWQFVVLSIAATSAGVFTTLALSTVIGYPLPFTIVIGTFPWFGVLASLLFVFNHQQLHAEPQLVRNVRQYMLVLLCQVALTIIYPSYTYVYSHLSSGRQTAFILVLPVIKIVTKNWISRTLPDTDDAKPEAVVFNVEIFHALFVSLCMGQTTSNRTIAALMLVDFIQAWLSFEDLRCIMKRLQPIATKLDAVRARTDSTVSTSRASLQSLVTIASTIITVEPFQAATTAKYKKTVAPDPSRTQSMLSSSWLGWQIWGRPGNTIVPAVDTDPVCLPNASKVQENEMPEGGGAGAPGPRGVRIAPTRKLLPTDLASLNTVERGVLVQQTQKFLFLTEYVVLIEYTEVIMPLIYDTLVFAMYHLPNRAYYTFLYGVCTPEALRTTLTTVLLYATLEFVSLVAIATILSWRLRLSIIHQLAFVLESRALNIQAKLLLWVLDTMQTSVVQLGPDYSFRFEWLRHPTTSSNSSTRCSPSKLLA